LFCFILFLPDSEEERQAAHKRRWSCAHSVESIDRLLGAASKLDGHFIKIWKNPTPNSPNQNTTAREEKHRQRFVNGRRNHEDQKKETADALCIPSLTSQVISTFFFYSLSSSFILRSNKFDKKKKEENWTTLVYTRRHIIIIVVISADQALLFTTIVLLLPSCYCATHKGPQVHFVVLRPNNRLTKESRTTRTADTQQVHVIPSLSFFLIRHFSHFLKKKKENKKVVCSAALDNNKRNKTVTV
jgi:hypothetical protein